MNPLDRRTFLKSATLAIGASAAARFTPSTWGQVMGANDAVRIAVIGLNGKGSNHVDHLLQLPNARVAALCDVDPIILFREVDQLRKQQVNVFATTDARKIFERSDIDAVVIATSNHWHALLTVWACQAGKDVYVEKPVSRTVWEGRKMVEAAEKYGRIVQAGTQFRSDTGWPEAIAWLDEGHLGKIQAIHTTCYKRRETIGQKLPWYPDWLDYDMFCGPTAMVPLERNRLEYDWHWVWRTGNGELGNNGPHLVDLARRIGKHDVLPRRVMSVGGLYGSNGAEETPNTQLEVYEYASGVPLFFESRGLPAGPDAPEMDHNRGVRVNGIAVLCEGGYYAGYTGGTAYDLKGERVQRFPGDGGGGHMSNFLAAVRSRRSQDLAAPIATGHGSSALCHFGNISYRLGRQAPIAAAQTSLEGIAEALQTLEGMQKHIERHVVDLEQQQLTVGPWLELDGANENIAAVENGDDEQLGFARYLLKESQRGQYAIPEQV